MVHFPKSKCNEVIYDGTNEMFHFADATGKTRDAKVTDGILWFPEDDETWLVCVRLGYVQEGKLNFLEAPQGAPF